MDESNEVIQLEVLGFRVAIHTTLPLPFDVNAFFLKEYVVTKSLSPVDLVIRIMPIAFLDHVTRNCGYYIFKTKMCRVYQAGLHKRRYEFLADSMLKGIAIDNTRDGCRKFDLFVHDITTAKEILYFYILSALGEWQEARNITRVHACTFIQGKNGYFAYGTEGAGKSNLALALKQAGFFEVTGDEIGLIDRNDLSVIPFMLPFSVKTEDVSEGESPENRLFKFSVFFRGKEFYFSQARTIQHKYELSKIFVLTERPRSVIYSRVILFCGLLLGKGLPQMTEYFVRPDNVHVLLGIVFRRLLTSIRLSTAFEVVNLPKFDKSAKRVSLIHNQIRSFQE